MVLREIGGESGSGGNAELQRFDGWEEKLKNMIGSREEWPKGSSRWTNKVLC